jgi:hypothetical protein
MLGVLLLFLGSFIAGVICGAWWTLSFVNDHEGI